MISTAALITSLLAAQAAALPYFWDTQLNGCEIPAQPYDDHMAPAPAANSAITLGFEITDDAGQAVTSWQPGMLYTITVDCAGTAGESCNLWVHTTIGVLEASGEGMTNGATCPELSIYSVGPDPKSGDAGADGRAASHTFTWTAPTDDSEPQTTLSMAAAFGSTSPYWTEVATFPLQASAADAPGAAPLAEGPGVPPLIEDPAAAPAATPAATPTTAAPPTETPETAATTQSSAMSFLGAMVAAICFLGAFVAI